MANDGGIPLSFTPIYKYRTLMTTELKEQDPAPTQEEEELKALETRIQFLEQERINLRVQPFVFDRLLRNAELAGLSIEDHCLKVLHASIEDNIGKPTIGCPSNLSGVVTKKVTGYTGSVQRG